jgi:hypothetical protein
VFGQNWSDRVHLSTTTDKDQKTLPAFFSFHSAKPTPQGRPKPSA